MSQVKRQSAKHHSALLAFVCLVLLLGILFRPAFARAVVGVGNQFFGGVMPYNLPIADTFYQTALFLDPQVPDAWHQRARIAFLGGDFGTALDRINTQIELHGDSFMASYYIRGLIEGYEKNYPAAEKDFLKFLEWSPNNWAANNDLAWLYFAQGKFKDAAGRSKMGLEKNPYSPWLLVMHAMSVYNLGDPKTAEDELKRAKDIVAGLREADWIHAYPGNNPSIAAEGLEEFKKTVEKDIQLVHSDTQTH